MAEKENGTFEVGYGKPPQHTRFKKGRSGNPSGRPRRSKSVTDLFDETLSSPIHVNIGGKRRRITVLQAILRKYVAIALKDDSKDGYRAVRDLLKMRLNWEQDAGNLSIAKLEFAIQTMEADLKERGLFPTEPEVTDS